MVGSKPRNSISGLRPFRGGIEPVMTRLVILPFKLADV
jgi:hypothetical protein